MGNPGGRCTVNIFSVPLPMPTNVLDAKIPCCHPDVTPPVFTQGERHVPGTNRVFVEMREDFSSGFSSAHMKRSKVVRGIISECI